MSAESIITATLQADATLSALLPGGIYADRALVDSVGENGINRRDTPDAFDANGYLRPCARVRGRGQFPYPIGRPLTDPTAQWSAAREMVEVHLYQAYGWDAITAARERVYALLHGNHGAGTYILHWAGDGPALTDPSLSNASHLRIEFSVVGYKAV